MLLQAFGENISILQYNGNVLGTESLKTKVENLFTSLDGNFKKIESTVNTAHGILPDILDFKNEEVGRWILNSMVVAANEIFSGKNVESVGFYKTWANKIYRNHSKVTAHRHQILTNPLQYEMVGVFYYEAPERSADLVIVKEHDNINNSTANTWESYSRDNRLHIRPTDGMLICHSSTTLHTVGTHDNDLPRTCFVFETKLNYKP
jgi:hypothetical protein